MKDAKAAKAERDAKVAAAEREFWRQIAQMKTRYHGAQTDIAEALGITRDYILKRTKEHTK
ncbi:hypothetical protein STRAU_0061 [Streptomyces aurantiacus JA 4570]|uniref:Uncharacterized protein n=2 Tax=Streptomyces aurantiacus TaxID=47760 RepID=S4A7X9_9ACTN|nr:hypothetical protein STRAU_0061 [Streptomyces aurantiacus JA 4570]